MTDQRTSTAQTDLAATLEALKASKDNELPTANIFYGLSGLTLNQLEQVKPVWETLSPNYRQKILQRMTDLSEANFEMDYHTIGFDCLSDKDAGVRQAAIDLLWEDESLEFMARLIDMAQWDEASSVRATAASELGRFILLGELGDLPESETIRAQDVVVGLWDDQDEDIEVRRRALEAISNCSNAIVPEAIQEAYASNQQPLRVSALYAMGRSYDERWSDIVLREIHNSDSEIRFEAARASGELELAPAVPALARLAEDHEDEIRDVSIWSLGEIGSREAVRVLERLAEQAYDAEDDTLLENIEDALANASLVGGSLPFMLDMDDTFSYDEDEDTDD
jgi:HEAT repeat protein